MVWRTAFVRTVTRTVMLGLFVAAVARFDAVVSAQPATATLSGTARDESNAVMPQVDITVTNIDTRLQRQFVTNDQGHFFVTALAPGRYDLTAIHAGFATVKLSGLLLTVGDHQALTLRFQAGQVTDVVVVDGRAGPSTQSAVSTVVDREFLETLPLNGRSLHALLELTPGTVLTTRGNAAQGRGQFSINGQRDNANYFTVDGVGANAGIVAAPTLGVTAGGTVPAFSVLGTTTSLVSVDAVQEFRVQTSTYAAEFGRTPGGQISVVTRSGTNAWHGSVFEHFRDDVLDATDWFANNRGLTKPPMRQHNFGGVVGGPIVKNRTFFFVSHEHLRLAQPAVDITPVPTVFAREMAMAAIQPFLKAFPMPNGKDLGNELAEFSASYSNPSTAVSTGVRVDHTFGNRLTVFGRYSAAPSEETVRGAEGNFNALSSLSATQVDTRTLTLGVTQVLGSTLVHELRFNYTRSSGANALDLDNFGGAIPPADSVLFPPFTSRSEALAGFVMTGGPAGFVVGQNVDNLQHHINLIDSLSFIKGAHQVKFGVDYRRLAPVLDVLTYGQTASFANGATGALTGLTQFVNITSNPERRFPLFSNLSAYAQDAWRVSGRLTVTAGLRWEVNPPPSEKNGNQAYTVIGLDNPATMTLAPKGTPLWNTSYVNVAPRVGAAYQLSPTSARDTVLRGGFGIFYDLGTGPIGSAFAQAAYPYFSFKTLGSVPFPLDPIQALPAPISLDPPYRNLVVADPNLDLPRVYQWSIALEQTIASSQTVSASYIGSAGRRLLRGETLVNPTPDFGNVSVVRNAAAADYRALQVQYRRPFSRGLQAMASYTWSTSVDVASDELFGQVPVALVDPSGDRGPSNFDVRHAFSGAVTYVVPHDVGVGPVGVIMRDWSMSATGRGRSGTPVNISAQPVLFGVRQAARPDVVPGVDLYVDDPTVAGGRRFNRAAFVTPPPGRQGTLGRNALRGFPVWQVDLSLRRRFAMGRGTHLELGADAFNVFNHPNFANPNGSLQDVTFGQSLSMFGQSLGGLNPLYQIGGPRSIQLVARATF